MELIINQEIKRIKNGWAIRAPQLGFTAHGHSQEVARLNLQRGIRLFLQPFQRNGTLETEIMRIGLKSGNGDEGKLVISLE